MNKKDLVKQTSMRLKLTQKECLDCLNAITTLIYEALSRGDQVRLGGFGKFCVKTRKEKMTYNPYTKQPMMLTPKIVPAFKSGKEFRESIR